MSARATNHAILFLLSVELLSGLISFTVGRPGGAWIFWLHGIAGFSLVGLVIWKYRIVLRSFRRRGVVSETMGSIILVLLFVGVLITGALWAIVGRGGLEIPFYGNVRLLVIHTTLGLALTIPLIVHAAMRWPRRPTRRDFTDRRAALRLIAVGIGGLLLWQGASAAAPRGRATTAIHRLQGGGERTGQRTPSDTMAVRQPTANRRRRLAAHCPRRGRHTSQAELSDHPGHRQPPNHCHPGLHRGLVHGPGMERSAPIRRDCGRCFQRTGREHRDRVGNRLQSTVSDYRCQSVVARHSHLGRSPLERPRIPHAPRRTGSSGIQLGQVGHQDRSQQQAVMVAIAVAAAVAPSKWLILEQSRG